MTDVISDAAHREMVRPGRLRETVLDILARERGEGGYATDLIAEALRRERFGSRERRLVAETVYGILRSQRLLDWALERTGARPEGRARDLARYLGRLVLDGAAPILARAEMPGIDWNRLGGAAAAAGEISDPLQRLAVTESLPDWLASRLVAELAADAQVAAHALNQRAPLTLRANTLKTTREALIERLKDEGVEAVPTRLSAAGVEVVTRGNVFGLAAFKDGLFEVQDEGSQLVAELVAPPPRGLVIDACAGAGGKTLHLGALLGGKGRVVALDIPPQAGRKLEELRRRARRAELHSVDAFEVEPRGDFPDRLVKLVGRADRVLVDAPCSGLGVLRRNPEARWRLTPAKLDELPVLQESLLERFAPLVAPGGRLIYATCTIVASENEDVVTRFLGRHPELVRMPAKEILGGARAQSLGDGMSLRVYPHSHGTDGFYATVLRRVT